MEKKEIQRKYFGKMGKKKITACSNLLNFSYHDLPTTNIYSKKKTKKKLIKD